MPHGTAAPLDAHHPCAEEYTCAPLVAGRGFHSDCFIPGFLLDSPRVRTETFLRFQRIRGARQVQ